MAKALDKMTFEELQAHQKEVAATLRGYEKKRRSECLKELKAVARKHGFTLDEVIGGKTSGGSKPKGAAKYANPADASQTWTGRGRQPNWVKEALAKGKSLDSMAI